VGKWAGSSNGGLNRRTKKASLEAGFFCYYGVTTLCEAVTTGTAWIAAAGASAVVMHFFKLGKLVRGKHRFIGVVAFGEDGLHLFSFFLGQEVVVLVDGFYLAAETFLTGFEFCDLVIGEVQVEPESFEAGYFHDLGVFGHPFAAFGHFIFLLGCEQSCQVCFLIFLQGDEAGFILFQGDIVLGEQGFRFLFEVLVDSDELLALLRRIVDSLVTEAAVAVTAAGCPALLTVAAAFSTVAPTASLSTAAPTACFIAATVAEAIVSARASVETIAFGETVAAGSVTPAAVHAIMVAGGIGWLLVLGGALCV
jgi:hypothetical protein